MEISIEQAWRGAGAQRDAQSFLRGVADEERQIRPDHRIATRENKQGRFCARDLFDHRERFAGVELEWVPLLRGRGATMQAGQRVRAGDFPNDNERPLVEIKASSLSFGFG